LEQFEPKYSDMRDIVFIAQMPHQRDGVSLEYSRWFQFLLGLLEVSIEYSEHFELGKSWAIFGLFGGVLGSFWAISVTYWTHLPSFMVEDALIQLEIRLAYRTHADDPNTWHELITTNATRTLQCT
uniref:Protein wntless homolog (inferred by orthology to a human protein) n=1 Tax=Anisakis simplex TaxID=6269 RepID=A0A0M3JMQ4_ANISI